MPSDPIAGEEVYMEFPVAKDHLLIPFEPPPVPSPVLDKLLWNLGQGELG